MGLSGGQRLVSASVKRPYRVVVAKPGLDGHDRGAKVIARALRDAGFEVIYTGLHQTAEQVVQAVIQEDADAVGLSLLSGAHLTLVPRVIDGLAEQGRGDVLVLVGGIIPAADIPVLKGLGVAEVFTPGPRSRPSGRGWVRRSTNGRAKRPADIDAWPRRGQNTGHGHRHDGPYQSGSGSGPPGSLTGRPGRREPVLGRSACRSGQWHDRSTSRSMQDSRSIQPVATMRRERNGSSGSFRVSG